jgi:poly(A) RNA polymerase
MEIIAGIMNICIPGIFNIRKILQARVPIIKFDHKLTGIECDLSMTNT